MEKLAEKDSEIEEAAANLRAAVTNYLIILKEKETSH